MAGNEEIIVDAEVWEPEQEDSFVLLSCKKCGKNVPAHYEFCPHCKKRLQKKKQKKTKLVVGLVITLLSLSTIVSTLCAIIYHDWYVDAIDDKYIIMDKLDQANALYAELKQQQESNASTQKSTPIVTPQTTRPAPQPTAAATKKPQQKVCAAASCGNPVEDDWENHIYCNLHECEKNGCMGYRDDPLSAYCAAHRCVRQGCHAERLSNRDVCISHAYE